MFSRTRVVSLLLSLNLSSISACFYCVFNRPSRSLWRSINRYRVGEDIDSASLRKLSNFIHSFGGYFEGILRRASERGRDHHCRLHEVKQHNETYANINELSLSYVVCFRTNERTNSKTEATLLLNNESFIDVATVRKKVVLLLLLLLLLLLRMMMTIFKRKSLNARRRLS